LRKVFVKTYPDGEDDFVDCGSLKVAPRYSASQRGDVIYLRYDRYLRKIVKI
jgi:hypothetical protein